MTAKQNKRYTPKRSVEALRQTWLTKDPDSPGLNAIGRVLALAARDGSQRFSEVVRQLAPETPNGQSARR